MSWFHSRLYQSSANYQCDTSTCNKTVPEEDKNWTIVPWEI